MVWHPLSFLGEFGKLQKIDKCGETQFIFFQNHEVYSALSVIFFKDVLAG